MPFTQEQIGNALQLLMQVERQTIPKIRRSLQLLGFKYEANGQQKTLPEDDKQSFESDYQKTKAILKAQVEALP